MIENILVVCEGNICRSPMAQGLLAQRLPGVFVTSSGSAALFGRPADPIAVDLMARRDIDISGHVAAAMNLEQVRGAQLVLTMTKLQRRWVERRYPFAKGRVFRIGEHQDMDIDDPYRKGLAAFEAVLVQIELGLASWLRVLNGLTH